MIDIYSTFLDYKIKKKHGKRYFIGESIIPFNKYKIDKSDLIAKNHWDDRENAYKKAIKNLLESNNQDPSNPDTLNLLGFSHRKIGDYDNAEIYYSMGLEIDPKHIGINEYMGELFVVTNRMDEAKITGITPAVLIFKGK